MNGRCQVCKNIKFIDVFDRFTTKKGAKSTINLSALISAWSTSLAIEHVVSNIQIRLLTVFYIYRWNNYKMEARKTESSDMENVKQKFLQSHFLQNDHEGFLEDVEVRLIDRHKVLTPLSENITLLQHLKLCTQMV